MASNKTVKAKGFKPETIKKIVEELQKLIAYYLSILVNGGFIKLVISMGNSKIG